MCYVTYEVSEGNWRISTHVTVDQLLKLDAQQYTVMSGAYVNI